MTGVQVRMTDNDRLLEADSVAGLGATAEPDTVLASLCDSVAQVVRVASRPPSRVSVRFGGASVEVEWPVAEAPTVVAAPAAAPATASAAGDEQAAEQSNRFPVCTPVVGTFYRAPEPGARPFVEVGDEVVPGQQVAIVEAMKLMNPIVADRPGRVVEILVENAEAVEYGQPLLLLEPVEGE
ncbi:MAG TPA: acetyl-CoA carboxylase biotin carboxyl carrier protein [Pseudonocardiaceae bacterium]